MLKGCVLGVLFGMEAKTLALNIGQPEIVARDLLRLHRETYGVFWKWSDAAVDYAMLTGSLHTVFGWRVHVGENPNPRSLRNFPMQANAADMMRIAACLATERGVEVCAPVHDAFLICAPIDRIEDDIAKMRAAGPGRLAAQPARRRPRRQISRSLYGSPRRGDVEPRARFDCQAPANRRGGVKWR